MVALYSALLISISYDDVSIGPVEVGAAVTALCVAAVLETGLSAVLVRLVQRATTLTLLLLTASLWSRQQPWGLAASALGLSLCALWWMEEDERRDATVEQALWRRKILTELHAIRRPVAVTGPQPVPALPEPVRPPPQLTVLPDTQSGNRVPTHHARPARRRGAHRSRVRIHRAARSPAADTVPGPRAS